MLMILHENAFQFSDAMMQEKQSRLLKEVDWLLENEVPLVLGHVKDLVSSCLQVALNKSPLKYSLMCTTSSRPEVLRGTFVLHKDTLCDMEVFMKPAKTGEMIKASFRNDKQWKLQQVQDAINHMKMVGRIVSTVICEQQTINHSPQGVVYILEDIIKQVVNCQMRLASPCQLSPNALIGNAFAKMFLPHIPGDALVNLYVLEDRLVLTCHAVQQAHTNASLSPSKKGKLHSTDVAGKSLFHQPGSMFEHGGARYELATSNRAECCIPMLSNLINTASAAQSLCQNLKDKIVNASVRID